MPIATYAEVDQLFLGETNSHALLASRGLAPPLLARFKNGLLYRFIRGRPCSHQDLVSPPIWRGVARRLAQWHAGLPSSGAASVEDVSVTKIADVQDDEITVIQPQRAGPSMWAVLQKWVLALPVTTPEQRARRLSLQAELQWALDLLDDGKGIGEDGVCASRSRSAGNARRVVGYMANRWVYSSYFRTAISSVPTSLSSPARMVLQPLKMVSRLSTSSIMNMRSLRLQPSISPTTLLSGVATTVITT